MQAYNNDPIFKERFLKEIKWHQDQDAIVQGSYGTTVCETFIDLQTMEWNKVEGFRGCAVGCSVRSLDLLEGNTNIEGQGYYCNHKRVAEALGLPIWLIQFEEEMFESVLLRKDARKWPYEFAEAINVGANYDDIKFGVGLYSAMYDGDYSDYETVLNRKEKILEMLRSVKGEALEAPAIEMVVNDEELFVPAEFTNEKENA